MSDKSVNWREEPLAYIWNILKEIAAAGPARHYEDVRKFEHLDTEKVLDEVPNDTYVLLGSLEYIMRDIARNRAYAFTPRDHNAHIKPFMDGVVKAIRSGEIEGFHSPLDTKVKMTEEDYFVNAGDLKLHMKKNPLPGGRGQGRRSENPNREQADVKPDLQRVLAFAMMFAKRSGFGELKSQSDLRHCRSGWGHLNR